MKTETYRLRWAQGRRRRPWGRVCRHLSRWRRYWRNHHRLRWFCL